MAIHEFNIKSIHTPVGAIRLDSLHSILLGKISFEYHFSEKLNGAFDYFKKNILLFYGNGRHELLLVHVLGFTIKELHEFSAFYKKAFFELLGSDLIISMKG
jgi:hypothetical protein